MEIGYKFFVSDELREKGNMEFIKGKFTEALGFYEKAASILRWLECKPNDLLRRMREVQLAAPRADQDIAEQSTMETTAEQEVNNNRGASLTFEDRISELLLTTFNDETVSICQGPLDTANGDHEIQNNILFGLYSNIAMCFLKMRHLKEAQLTIQEMEKISPKTSLLLFRKAQVVFADLGSDLAQLLEIQADIDNAIEMKKTEKIFEHNLNFLRMFNLQNHETAFHELRACIQLGVNESKERLQGKIYKVLSRAKQIERAELDIISRGLVPTDGPEKALFVLRKEPGFEMKLLKSVKAQYVKIVNFFAASDDPQDKEQLSVATNALTKVQTLIREFKEIWRLDLFTLDHHIKKIVETVNSNFK